ITSPDSRRDYAGGPDSTLLPAAARMGSCAGVHRNHAHLLMPRRIHDLALGEARCLAGTTVGEGMRGEQVTTSAFNQTANQPAGAQDEWLRVGSRRTFESIILGRERGEVVAGYVVGYTATGTSSVADQVKGLPLRLLGGQQLQAASRFVPLVADADVVVPTLP